MKLQQTLFLLCPYPIKYVTEPTIMKTGTLEILIRREIKSSLIPSTHAILGNWIEPIDDDMSKKLFVSSDETNPAEMIDSVCM